MVGVVGSSPIAPTSLPQISMKKAAPMSGFFFIHRVNADSCVGCRGQVQTVTNALSQVTTFDSCEVGSSPITPTNHSLTAPGTAPLAGLPPPAFYSKQYL